MADIMQRRHSPLVKGVLTVAGVGAVVYLIYLNHDANTKLKDTDDRAERFRRSHESLSAQLQDLSAAKEASEKKALSEKDEMINRLSAKAKENTLLKSQNEDLQSDFEKVQLEKEKLSVDLDNQKSEDKMEYERLKTEKEVEIQKLKDTIADQRNSLERLQADLNAAQEQNKNLQAMSIAANTTLSNLQSAHKELQVQYELSQQQVASLQQEKQKLAGDLKFAQNKAPALNVGGVNGVPQQGMLGAFNQQPQGGAVMMNQNQPGAGAADGAVANQQNQPNVDGAADNGVKPEVPDANDQGQFQIKVPNFGGDKVEGYNHEGDQGAQKDAEGVKPGVAEHKPEDDAQHQVQPPNFKEMDQGGLNHPNPLDRLGFKFGRRDRKLDEKEKDEQGGHDNRLVHQGALGLQVQEPVIGGDHDKDGNDGLEAPNDDNPDNGFHNNRIPDDGNHDDGGDGQIEGPGVRADQFMRNAHPNKQFPPHNGAHADGDEGEDEDHKDVFQRRRQDEV